MTAPKSQAEPRRTVIIGGGPAGLTAAYELTKAGVDTVVLEKDQIVGGISRTVEYAGYRFDIGGHRFFTKVDLVHKWWMEILESEFLIRPRLSRIYYKDKFFDYPLKAMNALFGLGLIEAVRIGLSYIKAQIFPSQPERNLEQWVSNRFGSRLFQIFFKTYTEKVWGIPCSEIGADWAAQRIKNLDLVTAVKSALLGARASKNVTTLIEQFHYPRHGPGMMWERVTELLAEQGHPIQKGVLAQRIHHEDGRVVAVTKADVEGRTERIPADHVISTMPIRELVHALDPAPPQAVLDAANKLRYRDFLTVGLIVDQETLFPDNWIYIHSEKVKVGRIQNFKNWSPEMVPDPKKTSLGLEYFVQENDELWSASDEDLIALGAREVEVLGLARTEDVVDGVVIRMPKAYPVYDQVYQEALAVIRGYLSGLPNLQLVGRNGQHRYNNQDHSMVTAIYAARNILGASYDVWDVNVEDEYHEEAREDEVVKGSEGATGDRLVPRRVGRDPIEVLRHAFARYDPVALGVSIGTVVGLGLFLATVVLLLKGGEVIGPNLALIGQYFLGFKVTWPGAFVGLAEGVAVGFALGWLMARTINSVVRFHERRLLMNLEQKAAFKAMDLEKFS